jgi:hypothetical protein
VVEQLDPDLDRARIAFANCRREIHEHLFGPLGIKLAELFELERRLPRNGLLESLVTGLTADGVIRRKGQARGHLDQRLRLTAPDATDLIGDRFERIKAHALEAKGIAPTSLQAYFQNSEPSRTVMVRLAHAGKVSVSWLASGHGPRSQDGLPEGYFGIPFIDFRASGGRIYPLLGQPTGFRIFRNADFERPADSDLMAAQMPESFEPYISDSDTLVINRSDRPSIGSGRPAATLREDGVYAVAQQARVLLRQLRWDKVGESLVVLVPGSKSKREMVVREKTLDFQQIGRVIWRGGPSI